MTYRIINNSGLVTSAPAMQNIDLANVEIAFIDKTEATMVDMTLSQFFEANIDMSPLETFQIITALFRDGHASIAPAIDQHYQLVMTALNHGDDAKDIVEHQVNFFEGLTVVAFTSDTLVV